ncbi:MAG: YlmC/YmxH family sporulation protein [Deltaproteobacteria bacterium]
MGRTMDFRQKEVINVCDGRRLGYICDVDIDFESGVIKAIVVPGPGRFLGLLGGGEDIVIPWDSITKVGIDTILVELDEGGGRRKPRQIREYESRGRYS